MNPDFEPANWMPGLPPVGDLLTELHRYAINVSDENMPACLVTGSGATYTENLAPHLEHLNMDSPGVYRVFYAYIGPAGAGGEYVDVVVEAKPQIAKAQVAR